MTRSFLPPTGSSSARHRLRTGLVAVLFAVGLYLAADVTVRSVGEAMRNAPKPLAAGTIAPAVAGQLLFSPDSSVRLFKPRALSELRGNVVLAAFYYTGCSGCFTALPAVSEMAEELGPRGFRALAVNILPPRMRAQDRQYLAKLGIRIEAVYDSTKAEAYYAVTGVPMFYLVDRSGRIAAHSFGMTPERQVAWTDLAGRAMIDSLLAAPRPPDLR